MNGHGTSTHAWDTAMSLLWVVAVAVVVWSARRTEGRDQGTPRLQGRLFRWGAVGAAGCVLFAGFVFNVDLSLPHENGGAGHWALVALFAAGLVAAVIAATWMVWNDAEDRPSGGRS